jgi:protein-S-isoprenylcysteine O-methyltransferase Ste14
MNQFLKWTEKEYSFVQRFLAIVAAGLLLAILIPYILVRGMPLIDRILNFPRISYGISNVIIGVFLIIIGLIFGFWSIFGQIFQAHGTPLPMMPTKKLLIKGPFRLCRNPMSLGTILVYLGIIIVIGSISGLAVVLVFSTLIVIYIKLIEEKELEARFGDEYLEYKEITPFMLPRIFPSSENAG